MADRRTTAARPAGEHGGFFDIWSRFYDATPFLRLALWRVQDDAVALLAPRPGERVLDLGCGPARGTRALLRTGAYAVAADYSLGMVAAARKHLGPGAPVVRLDALALPFADAAFDGILCTNSFHHYPDPPACLRQMRRVLKPGGRLVLVDPTGESLLARLVVLFGERIVFGLEGVHVHTGTQWQGMLRAAGFREVSTDRGRGVSPARRSEVFVRAVA